MVYHDKGMTAKEINAALLETLKSIEQRLTFLENKSSWPAPITSTPMTPVPSVEQPVSTQNTTVFAPIPLEYRLVVDSTLNKAFGIEIIPRSDAPLFEFAVIVPDKYSTLSEEYKKTYKSDRRPKVLGYADGVAGIKEWCEKVFNSFNQDFRTMIVADRVQGQ